jgi:hypothetical protein
MLYFFIQDLLFQSKVQIALNNMSLEGIFVREINELPISLSQPKIIIDLSDGNLTRLKSIVEKFPASKTLAFLPHVDKELQQSALNLGCQEVISRFEFSKNLPTLLLKLSIESN